MSAQKITLGQGHGIKVGDRISIPAPQAPRWVRLWHRLKRIPSSIECDVIASDATTITVTLAKG